MIFNFHGPCLGHVLGHLATCHMGVLHIKWKVLKSWYVWAPRFWKSDQNWGSYGLDNESILNSSLKSPYHIPIKELVRAVQDTFIVKAITPSILVQFSKSWCPNISAFQDLSFDVQNTHVARAHVPRNVSLSRSMKIKITKVEKKWLSSAHSSWFFLKIISPYHIEKYKKLKKNLGLKRKKL